MCEVVVLLMKLIVFLSFSLPSASLDLKVPIREKRRRWRLPKRHSKSEFVLLQTLSGLFHLVQFAKCGQFFLELNSKRLYQSSGKEKESRCFVFTSSTKLEIRHFHVVVVLRRQRNVQKSVMNEQSCCFANLTLFLCCRSRCGRRRRRCCLSLFSPSPVTVPEVFAKVNSVQVPPL